MFFAPRIADRRSFVCGGHDYFSEDHGEIVSHLGFESGRIYGKNLNCVWTIEAPIDMMVLLYAEAFSLDKFVE